MVTSRLGEAIRLRDTSRIAPILQSIFFVPNMYATLHVTFGLRQLSLALPYGCDY